MAFGAHSTRTDRADRALRPDRAADAADRPRPAPGRRAPWLPGPANRAGGGGRPGVSPDQAWLKDLPGLLDTGGEAGQITLPNQVHALLVVRAVVGDGARGSQEPKAGTK